MDNPYYSPATSPRFASGKKALLCCYLKIKYALTGGNSFMIPTMNAFNLHLTPSPPQLHGPVYYQSEPLYQPVLYPVSEQVVSPQKEYTFVNETPPATHEASKVVHSIATSPIKSEPVPTII